ncbi:MAG: HD domain-containing phosphohydrolase [Dehalococcoidia bacterium]
MRQALQALHELAGAALHGPAAEETLALAVGMLRRAADASQVVIVYAEDQDLLICSDAAEGVDTEISQNGLWFVQRAIVQLGGPVAFSLHGHRVEDFTTASSDEEREFLAFSLPTTEAPSEMCILRGPWERRLRPRVVRFMESAVPALTLLLERLLNAERGLRQKQQLQALTNAAQVLTESDDVETALADLAAAIAASTGFDFVSIDVYDASAERFVLRIINKARMSSGSLAQFWRDSLDPDQPDPRYVQVVQTRQPMLLPDLQNDERNLEPLRQFFQRAMLRSSALFPMLFQDKVLGVMAVTSFTPRSFPEEEIRFLEGLAAEAATALKAVRTYHELVESRERLRRYAQRIKRQQVTLRQQAKRLREMASTDALTGVRNYGDLHETTDRLLARAHNSGEPVAIIIADVDDFKLYNDTYGHLAGDSALKSLADALSRACRPTDIIGRYGGDEFMLILPNTNEGGALKVAERLLERVAQLQFRPEPGAEVIPLHLAIGVALYPDDGTTKEELIAHADAALYESKARPVMEKKITLAHEEGTDAELLRYPTSAFGVLHGLVRTVDRKDHYTKRHSEREAEYAVLLGQALKLSSQSQRALRIAGLLHDLGKIGIPDHLLRKPGPLTDTERSVMRQHVILTERIVGGVPQLTDVLAAAANHHERYDGSGYPRGLKGEGIPLLGRILAIADAFSAMTMDRPYRKALSWSTAVQELRRNTGTQFDPAMVEAFINEVLPQIDQEKAKAA